ncbi:long-chain fatty acid--CoA ligase [Deltaproteobacteria bacterium TL4]
MGEFGWKAFSDTETCEHFWMITANPASPSPIQGTQTMGMLMNGKSPVFNNVDTNSNDTAVILYTSGTTGHPKGAELTHSNLLLNILVARDLFQSKHDDIQLVVLPLFHSFGQVVQMNTGFLAGHTLVLVPRFEPETVFRLLEKENITIFCGVPTMYWALLHYPNADQFDHAKIRKNLRLGASGGASLPVEIMRAFEEKYGVPIVEGYGLSETSPVATFNSLSKERKPGSVGTAVWGVDVRIFDQHDKEVATGEVGEIVIRGHNVMKGYYQRLEATNEAMRNGWFHSGDLGKKDAEGYFYIVDRIKDMIIRGGYNVYPREIEELLITHPAISLAAVIGVPDEVHGEEIRAFVVLKEKMVVTSEEIISWCKERLANYKYPRIVTISERLPMTATGKILKRELRVD